MHKIKAFWDWLNDYKTLLRIWLIIRILIVLLVIMVIIKAGIVWYEDYEAMWGSMDKAMDEFDKSMNK